jgi:hypothetical protein
MFLLQTVFGEEYDLISAVSTSSRVSSNKDKEKDINNTNNNNNKNQSKQKTMNPTTDTFAFAKHEVSAKLSNVNGVKVQQRPTTSHNSKFFSLLSDAKDKFRERFVSDDPTLASVVGAALHFRFVCFSFLDFFLLIIVWTGV